MKCNHWLGHKWTTWHKGFGAPYKEPNVMGEVIIRKLFMRRRCLRCMWEEIEWMPAIQRIEKETP